MSKPFVIILTSRHRRAPKYLATYRAAKPLTNDTLGKDRRARITTTDNINNARGFASGPEAEAFIAAHDRGVGYLWSVGYREEVAK